MQHILLHQIMMITKRMREVLVNRVYELAIDIEFRDTRTLDNAGLMPCNCSARRCTDLV
jgi:hypothetical protein